MKDKRILIDIPVTHDEKMGLDLYDIRFAYDMFNNLINEFEGYNDMVVESWNDKQKDYANDSRGIDE
tara:strand:+ start:272 stop:472 length:201 start_codon:yes stop_codon:yes gene_type:complete